MRTWASLASAIGAALLVVLSLGAVGIVATQEQALFAPETPPAASPVPVETGSTPAAISLKTATPTPVPTWTEPPRPSATPSLTLAPSSSPSPVPATRRPAKATAASHTASRTVCKRPSGWFNYVVQRGDTLYRLAVRSGSSIDALRQANCLRSTQIYAGAILWVPRYLSAPYVPPRQSTATRRPPTATRRPPTATKQPPTATPSPPYGGGLAVPPELTGESPMPAAGPQVRAFSVLAAVFWLLLMAVVRLSAVPSSTPFRSHELRPCPTEQPHDTGP
jgi:LysM repeat protein